jgi:hypothetical protein
VIQQEESSRPYVAVDGFSTLTGGMNSGLDPELLQTSQFARGINMTTRGGLASTRPGFQKIADLGAGTLQGCGVLILEGREWLLYAIGGRVFTLVDNSPVELWAGLDPSATIHFTQVYRWMVAQDGVSRPAVFEEVGGELVRLARDAELEPEFEGARVCLVPGTIGFYAHGRYHYTPTFDPELLPGLEFDPEDETQYSDESLNAVPTASLESGRTGFVSSDILDTLDPYKIFQMSEHRVLDEGGLTALPAEHGFVHGMCVMRGAATGTGMGALYVFGTRGVSAFDVASPRSSVGGKGWKDIGFSQVAFNGVGTLSPFSIVSINDDIWYVDQNGELRSVTYDASQMTQAGYAAPALFNVSKSFEAKRWTDITSRSFYPYISAAHADNRLHWVYCDGKAVGALDFAQVHSANPSEIPILHEGIWTGFDFIRVLTMDNTLHAIVSESGSLYLLKLGGDLDLGATPIKSELVTRSMGMWYNEMQNFTWLKKLLEMELHVSGVTRPTSIRLYFRPSLYPEWTLIGEKSLYVPENSPPQSRILSFKIDYAKVDACDPISHQSLYFANAYQFKIEWVGRATLSRFVVWAQRVQESPEWVCDADNPDGLEYPAAELAPASDFTYAVQVGVVE